MNPPRPTSRLRSRSALPLSPRLLGLVGVLVLAAACGSPPASLPPATDTLLSTHSLAGTVGLPAGLAPRLQDLTVLDAVASAPVAPGGTFTLPGFDLGPQLAIALSPKGTPMLLGWLDEHHTAITANTTAQVLVYFAAGIPQLPPATRAHALELLPNLPGLDTLEAAITAELRRDPDALAAPNPTVMAALNALVRPLFASAPTALGAGKLQAQGVLVNPQDELSGVKLNTGDLNTIYLTNATRRRGRAIVERVSYTQNGVVTADPAKLPTLEVPPTIGLSGGLFGTLNDIVSAYFGTQGTAYGPVDSDKVTLPIHDGASKTTYQVTLVGPGLNAGVAATLTPEQRTELTEVSLRGFTVDALFPFLVNGLLGSGVIDYTSGQGGVTGKFLADVAGSLTTDLVSLAPQVPGLQDQITSGDWKSALQTLWTDAAGSNTLRTAFIGALDAAKSHYASSIDPSKFKNFATAFSKFNVVVNAAGGFLQVFDSSVYARALQKANRADRWTADAVGFKVKLTPPGGDVAKGGSLGFAASAPDAGDATGFTYAWKNTGKSGTLHEVGGGGRTSNDYCSSSAKTTYVQEGSSSDTDSVSVSVYPRPACKGEPLGTASAAVKITNNPWVGTWLGSVTSTCGYYSGPFNLVITSTGDDTLGLSGTVGYPLRYSGNTATSFDGRVVYTLNGNTMTGVEADSCQLATLTRSSP